MQEDDQPNSVRSELLERLRAMEGPGGSSDSLADLAYRRAREALERALEEARTIRLQAIEDARSTRESELSALMESMRSLRQSAESQINTLLRSAEIEAARIQDQARQEAESMREQARNDAAQVRAEASALRSSAEERLREIEKLETDFNTIIGRLAQRLGIKEEPQGGWWHHLTSR